MRCNHTNGMPRGDFNIYLASSRRGYVRAEEYVHLFHTGIKGGGMLYIFNDLDFVGKKRKQMEIYVVCQSDR